ncbi:MAG: phage holin family protein [Mangrovibacterium sp.]
MMEWIYRHVFNMVSAFILMLVSYFSPIRGVVVLMVVTITADLLSGLHTSYVLGIGIRSKLMWRTIYKLVYALLLVALGFALDKELSWDIGFYKLFAAAVIGFELWSIIENWTKVSRSPLAQFVKRIMTDRIKAQTGVDLNKANDEKDK